MEPHHETGLPATLCRWVGEIVQSSPEAARLTLLELIVGALLASGGHVTQAILALTPRLGWQAYHCTATNNLDTGEGLRGGGSGL
jgi:hypothetical protein